MRDKITSFLQTIYNLAPLRSVHRDKYQKNPDELQKCLRDLRPEVKSVVSDLWSQ